MNAPCHDIEPLLALRADAALDPAQQDVVEAHLASCPDCRQAAAVQQQVRELLVARADGLRALAPDDLRARLRTGADRRHASRRWRPFTGMAVRLPVAASLVIALLGLGVYSMTSASTQVLAAQLALDHLKCVRLEHDARGNALDPADAGEAWREAYHWALKVPVHEVGPEQARLIGVRRCLYGHGHLAHLLYNVNGRVVSLFVMPRDEHASDDHTTLLDVFGHQARVWGDGEQTFALVSDADAEGLDVLEQRFRAAE